MTITNREVVDEFKLAQSQGAGQQLGVDTRDVGIGPERIED